MIVRQLRHGLGRMIFFLLIGGACWSEPAAASSIDLEFRAMSPMTTGLLPAHSMAARSGSHSVPASVAGNRKGQRARLWKSKRSEKSARR